MTCSKCKLEKLIVNKHFKMCLSCNGDRLKELKQKNGSNTPKKKNNALKSFKKKKTENFGFVKNFVSRKTTQQKIDEDEEFYKKCFDNCKIHECEECGDELPDVFLTDDGKVNARYRYSHIVAKSIASELRHSLNNINHLCQKCHNEWEFGKKELMKIFIKNKKRFPKYF